MNGCSMPVVINSGSGNQGMTCSLPVIEYAKELKVSKDKLYRALVVSNLVAIHQKSYIGSLSAYCGAVSAACGAGAAIAWLNGGDYEAVARTITNALANTSGMVCDGAKSSCAAKIASAVDAAIMAYTLESANHCFQPGEGLVKDNVEDTIRNMGYVGRVGMKGYGCDDFESHDRSAAGVKCFSGSTYLSVIERKIRFLFLNIKCFTVLK